jgi:hypothetical protein
MMKITRPASRLLSLVLVVAVVVSLIGWSTGSAHGSGRDIVPLSAPDGALGSFSALGTGADEYWLRTTVWSIAKWGTNRIVVGGQFRGMGGVPSTSAVAVWNGSAWSALGSGFDPGQVYSVAALDDDTLVAAVYSNFENDPDGQPTSFQMACKGLRQGDAPALVYFNIFTARVYWKQIYMLAGRGSSLLLRTT